MGEECHRTLLCYGDVGKDDPFPTRTVVFSGGVLPTQRTHLTMSGDRFSCHMGGGLPLASRR